MQGSLSYQADSQQQATRKGAALGMITMEPCDSYNQFTRWENPYLVTTILSWSLVLLFFATAGATFPSQLLHCNSACENEENVAAEVEMDAIAL